MSTDAYVALTGAINALRELDMVANNLANVETLGFKRDRASFVAALEAAVESAEGEPAPGGAGHVFAATDRIGADFAPGPVAPTGDPLDVALLEEGFFEVQGEAGPRYTRAGSFVIDAQGRITTPSGLPVMGESGPLQAGDRPVSFTSAGELVDDTGQVLGRLRVVRFDDPSVLTKVGGSLFEAEPGAAPVTVPEPRLAERSVERSNVSPVEELAALVVLQRSFDLAIRNIQNDDEAMQALLQEVSS